MSSFETCKKCNDIIVSTNTAVHLNETSKAFLQKAGFLTNILEQLCNSNIPLKMLITKLFTESKLDIEYCDISKQLEMWLPAKRFAGLFPPNADLRGPININIFFAGASKIKVLQVIAPHFPAQHRNFAGLQPHMYSHTLFKFCIYKW